MTGITNSLDAIVEVLREDFRDAPDGLRKPASLAELVILGEALGLEIPQDLKQLLSWHNGERHTATSFMLAEFSGFYSAKRIVEEHSTLSRLADEVEGFESEQGDWDVTGGVQPVMWHSGWIPFWLYRVPWAIDTVPTAAGKYGQIISVDWEDRSTSVCFESLKAMLASYLKVLRTGRRDFEFVFDD